MALAVEPVLRPAVLPEQRPDRSPARPRARRDVFVDVVRALGTVGIVSLHWLMPEATFDGTTLRVGNALGHGAAWALTWVAQTLPLMFFAAGAAAAYQHSATVAEVGPGWGSAVLARVRGVARPVGVFLGAWVVAVTVLIAVGVPDDAVWRLARMAPQLLWFLAVWVVLIPFVPLLQSAWRRWRWRAAAVAIALPLLVDVLRFGAGVEGVAWANLMLVWAVPFVAGVAYATDRNEGRRGWLAEDGGSSRTPALVALAGLAAMAALVAFGPYPASMVGMPGADISNLGPPTAPVVAQSVAQVCAVLAVRGMLTRWAASGGGRAVVGLLSRHSMTVYLWHLTAMFAVVGVVLMGLGQRLPEPWTADWWATRPTWFAAFLLVLLVLGRVFGRAEGSRGKGSRGGGQLRGSGTA
jgi:hypothetical protein